MCPPDDVVPEEQLRRLQDLTPLLESARAVVERHVREILQWQWTEAGNPGEPTVYSRVKSPASVLRHVIDRRWTLEEIPDLIGVRVVVLHQGELAATVNLDQLTGVRPQRTSYRAIHGRGSGYSGLTYSAIPLVSTLRKASCHESVADDPRLAPLRFEIQVHTAMQEAWSRLSHSRFYKGSEGVPHESRVQLERLAALTDLMDEHLVAIAETLDHNRRSIWAALNDPGRLGSLRLDEYVLAKSQALWPEIYRWLVDVARGAELPGHDDQDLVRVGDETEICLAVFADTGIATTGEFLAYCRQLMSGAAAMDWPSRLRAVLLPGATEGLGHVGRPLVVLSVMRLIEVEFAMGSFDGLGPTVRRRLVRARATGQAATPC